MEIAGIAPPIGEDFESFTVFLIAIMGRIPLYFSFAPLLIGIVAEWLGQAPQEPVQ